MAETYEIGTDTQAVEVDAIRLDADISALSLPGYVGVIVDEDEGEVLVEVGALSALQKASLDAVLLAHDPRPFADAGTEQELSWLLTWEDSGTLDIGAVNASWEVASVDVDITTTFDDAAASLLVGVDGTPGLFFASGELKLTRADSSQCSTVRRFTSPTTLQATIAPGTSTQGAALITIRTRKV